ncbi:MAG: ATP-binding protein [Clostridia bacterium]|nr:ATP-binding protein [Clostridia bacterium]
MRNKIYFKISFICIIAVLILTLLSGVFISIGQYNFYYKNMCENLFEVRESNFINSFNDAINSPLSDDLKAESIESSLCKYNGNLSINENRKVYILKDNDLSVVSSKAEYGDKMKVTENIMAASSADGGCNISYFGDALDCAYSFKGSNGEKYILYLKDNKADIRSALLNNLGFIGITALIALIVALISSLFISRKITVPVKKITKRAEGLEKGELHEIDDIKESEFVELRDAVNHMGFVMAESIRQMNSDKHRVEVILEHVNNGIITFDINQNPIQINSAARKIFNINENDNIKFDSFFKKLDADVCMAEFLYLDKSKTIEREIKKDEGYIKTWFIPFKMDSERNAGVVCVFEDITEQFNVMEAMRKFVADVSHELKTPITVISSYTETVLNSYIDDKAMTANLLNIVYEEAGKMTELVQNLLDISKYEMKAIPVKKEPFSIDDMLLSLVKTFELEAEKKELSLNYTRMTDIPMFLGSRSDIERAIKNILSNSIKYTSRGDKINVFAGKLHNEIYIKVEDTGWGIPESKLGHLFERFYRVEDEARSRDKGGTGLGLSIAKEIIESYKGKIKIESEYTKYTRVTITLPVPK